MIDSVTRFLYSQPREVQAFVGDAVESDVDVYGKVRRAYGDKYSDEEIDALIIGARIALR